MKSADRLLYAKCWSKSSAAISTASSARHDLQKMSKRKVTKYLAAIGRLATTMNEPNPIARPFWWLPLSATPTAHPMRQRERRASSSRRRRDERTSSESTVAPAWDRGRGW